MFRSIKVIESENVAEKWLKKKENETRDDRWVFGGSLGCWNDISLSVVSYDSNCESDVLWEKQKGPNFNLILTSLGFIRSAKKTPT